MSGLNNKKSEFTGDDICVICEESGADRLLTQTDQLLLNLNNLIVGVKVSVHKTCLNDRTKIENLVYHN